jgi:hypothetical protein
MEFICFTTEILRGAKSSGAKICYNYLINIYICANYKFITFSIFPLLLHSLVSFFCGFLMFFFTMFPLPSFFNLFIHFSGAWVLGPLTPPHHYSHTYPNGTIRPNHLYCRVYLPSSRSCCIIFPLISINYCTSFMM